MTQPLPEPAALDGITIVIPVQNRGTTLHEVLTEWMTGTADLGREIDWVIVDDGSTDNTATVLDSLRAAHPLLTIHRHPLPQGFGACLRTAGSYLDCLQSAFCTTIQHCRRQPAGLALQRR